MDQLSGSQPSGDLGRWCLRAPCVVPRTKMSGTMLSRVEGPASAARMAGPVWLTQCVRMPPSSTFFTNTQLALTLSLSHTHTHTRSWAPHSGPFNIALLPDPRTNPLPHHPNLTYARSPCRHRGRRVCRAYARETPPLCCTMTTAPPASGCTSAALATSLPMAPSSRRHTCWRTYPPASRCFQVGAAAGHIAWLLA
jgi:hypothetical protein